MHLLFVTWATLVRNILASTYYNTSGRNYKPFIYQFWKIFNRFTMRLIPNTQELRQNHVVNQIAKCVVESHKNIALSDCVKYMTEI